MIESIEKSYPYNSIQISVLLLNQNYQPLNICSARRAIALMGLGKAESIITSDHNIRSATMNFPVPSVIRLYYMVKIQPSNRKLSRQALFYRDKFTCQYCSKQTRQLTIDHVKPRSKGGLHTWENVVSACSDCNQKKAELTLIEANLKLKTIPKSPYPNPYYIFQHRNIEESWKVFIPWES